MNKRTLRDTELSIILEDIARYSLSPEGRDYINEERLSSDEKVLGERFLEIDSMRRKLSSPFVLEPFPSLSDLFSFVSTTHRDIDGEMIYRSGEFLNSLTLLLAFEEKEDMMGKEMREMKEEILSSLTPEGLVNPDHPKLKPLMRKRDDIRAERYRYSMSFISSNRQIVQNENPIYRNERIVIPVRSSERRSGSYYISGESQSGQTTYVEPFELVDLNNRVTLAEEAIRLEKIRIIHSLSESVRSSVPFLQKMTQYVVSFNFYYVFALWSLRVNASHIERGDDVYLVNAVHPLLGEKAVPVTLSVPSSVHALVLSGANCGGKSVTMKTVALLSLLNQICTFIPASPLSRLPYFDAVYTDIGDGQSIAEEASTFSSHMSNIADIARQAGKNSLVILDELGSGTDPAEGSSLSLSILSYLSKRTFLTICTSHYNTVKAYAYSAPDMMNASMEFDRETSLPTYRILSGIPGDSHALATARRSGMPDVIIRQAEETMKKESSGTSQIITSLLSKSRTLDRKISELAEEKRKLDEKTRQTERREMELEKALLCAEHEGVGKIEDFLSDARKRLENLVRLVKTGELTKEKTKAVREYVDEMTAEAEKIRKDVRRKEEENDEKTPSESFKVGDEVFCGEGRTRGKVVALRDQRTCLVSFENGLRMNVRNSTMVHADPVSLKVDVSDFRSERIRAKYTLDVRGLTLSQTERALDDEIEAALLTGLGSFAVIHGYGDGILQKGVHMYLKKNRYVSDYRFALPEDGGMGKTYVTLNSV